MPLGHPTSLRAHAFICVAILSRFVDWMRFTEASVALKPVPVLILLAGVLRWGRRGRPRTLVVAGLALGALGDVLLEWPGDLFVPGLVAFLASHLAYAGAFVLQERTPATLWLVFYAIIGAAVFATLAPGLGAMMAPVAVYMVVIVGMAWRAGALLGRVTGGGAAVLGASLFLLSDAMLAYNKFHTSFTLASEAVMVSYWAAQFWIARSVLQRSDAA
jgi:uncharacterized membrane protein YhhN